MLDVLAQQFTLALLDGEEVTAHPELGERPREVDDELTTQLALRHD